MENAETAPKKKWDWREHKPNNMMVIGAGPTTGFFKVWCTYLRPVVDLTDKEIDIVASFLKQRWELSKIISDVSILDSQLMSNDTKDKVIKECKVTRQHFYVIMSTLRKKNVITSAGINPKLIPNINKDASGDGWTFQYLILFKEDARK